MSMFGAMLHTLGFEPPTSGFQACDLAHWARRTPSSSGGGHLDPPGAPGAEVSLCGGVRDPWALTTTFAPL